MTSGLPGTASLEGGLRPSEFAQASTEGGLRDLVRREGVLPDDTMLARGQEGTQARISEALDADALRDAPSPTRAEIGFQGDVPKETYVFQPLEAEGKSLSLELTPAEARIYQTAELRAHEVGGKDGLVRSDLDLNHKDALGMTNRERMKIGLSPIDAQTGLRIELHHIGQDPNGPLAELTVNEHRSTPNNLTLHPVRSDSPVEHGLVWDAERSNHWQTRAEMA